MISHPLGAIHSREPDISHLGWEVHSNVPNDENDAIYLHWHAYIAPHLRQKLEGIMTKFQTNAALMNAIYDNMGVLLNIPREQARKCFHHLDKLSSTRPQKALAIKLSMESLFPGLVKEQAQRFLSHVRAFEQDRRHYKLFMFDKSLDPMAVAPIGLPAPLSAVFNEIIAQSKGDFIAGISNSSKEDTLTFYKNFTICCTGFWNGDVNPELLAQANKVVKLLMKHRDVMVGISIAMAIVTGKPQDEALKSFQDIEGFSSTNKQKAIAIKLYMNSIFGYAEYRALQDLASPVISQL